MFSVGNLQLSVWKFQLPTAFFNPRHRWLE